MDYDEKRTSEIRYLLSVVKNTIGDESKKGIAMIAIRKLGRMRAKEGIPLLVENLLFEPLRDSLVKGIVSTEELWPSVYALGEIGVPAFSMLLEKAQVTDDKVTHYCVAIAIYHAVGEEIGKLYLNHSISKLPDGIKKRRLEKVSQQFIVVAKDMGVP